MGSGAAGGLAAPGNLQRLSVLPPLSQNFVLLKERPEEAAPKPLKKAMDYSSSSEEMDSSEEEEEDAEEGERSEPGTDTPGAR